MDNRHCRSVVCAGVLVLLCATPRTGLGNDDMLPTSAVRVLERYRKNRSVEDEEALFREGVRLRRDYLWWPAERAKRIEVFLQAVKEIGPPKSRKATDGKGYEVLIDLLADAVAYNRELARPLQTFTEPLLKSPSSELYGDFRGYVFARNRYFRSMMDRALLQGEAAIAEKAVRKLVTTWLAARDVTIQLLETGKLDRHLGRLLADDFPLWVMRLEREREIQRFLPSRKARCRPVEQYVARWLTRRPRKDRKYRLVIRPSPIYIADLGTHRVQFYRVKRAVMLARRIRFGEDPPDDEVVGMYEFQENVTVKRLEPEIIVIIRDVIMPEKWKREIVGYFKKLDVPLGIVDEKQWAMLEGEYGRHMSLTFLGEGGRVLYVTDVYRASSSQRKIVQLVCRTIEESRP